MPPHVKKRRDRSGTFYLIDGRLNHSLKTKVRRYAEARLEQYVRGQFGLGPKITVKEYYAQWIETKKEPFVRRSAARDYRQAFTKYILPLYGDMALCNVSLRSLQTLRDILLKSTRWGNFACQGLSPKTIKNILTGSFRALWKDAMAEEIVDKNPFAALRWPRAEQLPPDPFTTEERDKILARIEEKQPFYYPLAYTMFFTGMRPSEASALRLSDVDPQRRTISITKSRHLGAEAATKTAHSRRLIAVSQEIIDLLEAIRLPWQTSESHVFYNKFSGGPLDPNQWARVYWKGFCSTAGVRYRKFYSTRHTFITEAVRRGENLKALADYCGTSVTMIEKNYCGVLELRGESNRFGYPFAPKYLETLAVPTGLEPDTESKDNIPELINPRLYERLRRRMVG